MRYFIAMKNIEDKILEKENILVVLPKEAKMEVCASAFGLALALEKIGKNVQVISEKADFDILHQPKKVLKKPICKGNFYISIKKTEEIEELRYEKTENEIKIHLNPKTNGLPKDIVSTKFLNPPFGLVIVFGAEAESHIKDFFNQNSDILEEADLVFVGKNPYSLFVFELAHKLKVNLCERISTNIFASALYEIQKEPNKKNSKLLKLIFYLLKYNAEYEKVLKKIHKKSIKNPKIAETIFKNSSYVSENVILSKIPNFELENLKLSSNELISDIIDMSFLIPKNTCFFILVEPPKKTEKIKYIALVVSKNKKLSDVFISKKDYALFSVLANSLSEAEKKIIKLIKQNV